MRETQTNHEKMQRAFCEYARLTKPRVFANLKLVMAVAANGESFAEGPASPAGSPLPAPQDELIDLARAAAQGSGAAASTLVTLVGGSMLRSVRKVLGAGHPDVDDVMQDSVIALISSLASFRGECQVIHFANRVAVLTAMAARRRWWTRQRFTEPDASLLDLPDSRRASPLDEVQSARRRQIVRQLLDEMPEVIAEAVALHFILGYTVDEIASAASVPANTVWSRLRLGKQRIRKELAKHGLDDGSEVAE